MKTKKGAVEFSMTTIFVIMVSVVLLGLSFLFLSLYLGDGCFEKDIDKGLCECKLSCKDVFPNGNPNEMVAYSEDEIDPQDSCYESNKYKGKKFGSLWFNEDLCLKYQPKSQCQLYVENLGIKHYEKFAKSFRDILNEYPHCKNQNKKRDLPALLIYDLYEFDCPIIKDFDKNCVCTEYNEEIKLPTKEYLDNCCMKQVQEVNGSSKIILPDGSILQGSANKINLYGVSENAVVCIEPNENTSLSYFEDIDVNKCLEVEPKFKSKCTKARLKSFEDLNCPELEQKYNNWNGLHSDYNKVDILKRQIELKCLEN